jgi:hypothetical protein
VKEPLPCLLNIQPPIDIASRVRPAAVAVPFFLAMSDGSTPTNNPITRYGMIGLVVGITGRRPLRRYDYTWSMLIPNVSIPGDSPLLTDEVIQHGTRTGQPPAEWKLLYEDDAWLQELLQSTSA